jgi:Fic family protein
MRKASEHVNTETVETVFKELCRNQLRNQKDRNYARNIIRSTGMSRQAVAGALNHLERIGVVLREWNGRRKQLTVNPGVLDELKDDSEPESEVEA